MSTANPTDPKQGASFPSQRTRDTQNLLPSPRRTAETPPQASAERDEPGRMLSSGLAPAIMVSMLLWLGIAALVLWILA